jgi:hypothetical protein
MSDREVVQQPVGVTKPQHEPRRAEIAGDADNSAVDGPLTLDLDPVTPATCSVGPIDALGDHPFETGNFKPGFSDVDVRRVRHELEARMARHEQSLEHESPLRKWQSREVVARELEDIKDQQDGRPRRDRFGDELSSERQTLLQCAKVCLAALVGDDNLAVNQGVAR